MKKLILTLMLGIFLVSLVSASDLGTFKKGECIELYQLCDNCTYVNLSSVTYPNSTILNLNEAMTENGVDYNYTFCSTNVEGDMSYKVCGDKDGEFICETIDLRITPLGTSNLSIFNNPLLLLLAGLALIFLFLGIYFSNPSLGFISSVLFILAGVYLMIYGFNDITNLYTRGGAVSLIGLGFVILFASGYEWYMNKND